MLELSVLDIIDRFMSAQEVTPSDTRAMMDEMLQQGVNDFGGIPGVILVKKNAELPKGMSCMGFARMQVTGESDAPNFLDLSTGYEQAVFPTEGGLVAYINRQGEVGHLGVVKEGKLLSKFGNEGDVYLASFDAVPSVWGTVKVYFNQWE